MQTMNQALARYVQAGVISEQEALARAGNLTELKQMLRRLQQDAPRPQPQEQPPRPA